MANRKPSSKRPQPRHRKNHQKSQFDRRNRLGVANPKRRRTLQARVPLIGSVAGLVGSMAGQLDCRMAFRLSIIVAGMFLADGRKTAAAWFAAAGVQDDWDRFYDCLISIGRQSQSVGEPLVRKILEKFDPGPGGHLTACIDDSPTSRYGRHVEGAGVHHNPTPGPVGSAWVYGHNWVCMALLCAHPLWGVIAMPLWSKLYVREADVPQLNEKHNWEFHTKHALALQLVTSLLSLMRRMRMTCSLWLVMDGAYAAGPLLRSLCGMGVVVFSRLRKDAVLFDLPPKSDKEGRGRPRIYGFNRIKLRELAEDRRGWETINYRCRGAEVVRQYKCRLATTKLTGDVIRVVIVRFADGGWAPYFCTNPEIGVRDILETISARWAIEEHFHDTKEIWGAEQQQVRNVWSNIGCWHLNGWLYSLVELISWDKPQAELSDRLDRPWDNPSRRPSHADRRRTIRREMLEKQFTASLPMTADTNKIRQLFADLISLSA